MTTRHSCAMQNLLIFIAGTVSVLSAIAIDDGPVIPVERPADTAEASAEGREPEMIEPEEVPKNLQDLTQGEGALVREGIPWNMGPVGIVGFKNRYRGGDQIRVMGVDKGSPAEGKVRPGDVILGLNGRRFDASEDINRVVGDAIIKAEEESSGGKLVLNMWRDRNWSARMEAQNQASVDLDEIFKDVMSTENDLYLWQSEEERTQAVKTMRLGKNPIDPETFDVEVKLEVMGTYSDTSPWNCPVATKIRENALKVISARIGKGGKGRGRHHIASWPDILALVASGKPEYVAQARQWVHSQNMEQDMNRPAKPGGSCWGSGFDALERAIYLDATGDEYVKAQVRYDALRIALCQGGGGTWGHAGAYPHMNFGRLHGMLAGNYGAVNNAGSRLFMLLALAKKNGIEHPEINAAIWRSRRFFRTFVDKGAIPYGYGPPRLDSDDNNGRSYGAAYALYAIGDWYSAKYYAMNSAHACFTRRGGHGSRTFWYYSPFCAQMAGPKAVQAYMRNMRYFFTLSRRHDGSFIFLADWGIGGRGMRNPTATMAMYYCMPLHQIMITGKDADTRTYMTDKEYDELMFSANTGWHKHLSSQLGDPVLIKQAGKSMNERSTDDLIEMLDHFFPYRRFQLAGEVGRRYAAGEKDIPSKLLPRLSNGSPRMRDGVCRALGACGEDVVRANLSKIIKLLDDESEAVRVAAVHVISEATKPNDKTREEALLRAAAEKRAGVTADNGNLLTSVRNVLLKVPGKKDMTKPSLLLTSPFKAGYDRDIVRSALAKMVMMDPSYGISSSWDKETVMELAGPLTYAAFEPQVNSNNKGGSRGAHASALLNKYGYREGIEGELNKLIRRGRADRHERVMYGSLNSNLFGDIKVRPGRYRDFLGLMCEWQFENPGAVVGKTKESPGTPLNKVIARIEKDTTTPAAESISKDTAPLFMAELEGAGDLKAQVQFCCDVLADREGVDYFRKRHAMDWLVKKYGVKSMPHIAPYLGYHFWSVDEHAGKLLRDMVKQGGGDQLIQLFKAAQARDGGFEGNLNAAGMLMVFADTEYKPALPEARAALKHRDPVVRKAAVQAVCAIGGEAELSTVFGYLREAKDGEDFVGVEMALLRRKHDPAFVAQASRAARAMLPRCEPAQRRSLAWVLGKYGGSENLLALQRAAMSAQDDKDLTAMLHALALSPDRAATDTMLELLKVNERMRDAIAPLFQHRMLGPGGWNDVTDSDRLRLARSVLGQKFDKGMIRLLGRTHTQGALQLLYDIMKIKPEMVVDEILDCAEGMKNPSKSEAATAKEVLTAAIEFMEVTWFRNGPTLHKGEISGYYLNKKEKQARAAKLLLTFAVPEADAADAMDGVDFDL